MFFFFVNHTAATEIYTLSLHDALPISLRRYNLTLNLLSRSHDLIASGRQIAINGHIKFNLTIPLQQLNGLETLVIIMVAKIGRAVQQECRDRSRMPSSA